MIKIKQDDTKNVIYSQLLRDGVPINLTDCKVYISVSGIVYEDECTIIDAEEGTVVYPLARVSGSFGQYMYEYIVKYSDGTTEIVPNDKFEKIAVVKRLKERLICHKLKP